MQGIRHRRICRNDAVLPGRLHSSNRHQTRFYRRQPKINSHTFPLNYRGTKPAHNYTATERKPTIGEINLISHPDIKGHTQGKQFTDPRGWSRWIGIILQGPKAHVSPNGVKVHRKIAIIAVYGPCKSSKATDGTSSTRMWDKQKSAMSKIPANKRQDDPKLQFVADLAEQIKKLENNY